MVIRFRKRSTYVPFPKRNNIKYLEKYFLDLLICISTYQGPGFWLQFRQKLNSVRTCHMISAHYGCLLSTHRGKFQTTSCCKTGILAPHWGVSYSLRFESYGLFMFDYENLGKNLSENVCIV